MPIDSDVWDDRRPPGRGVGRGCCVIGESSPIQIVFSGDKLLVLETLESLFTFLTVRR